MNKDKSNSVDPSFSLTDIIPDDALALVEEIISFLVKCDEAESATKST